MQKKSIMKKTGATLLSMMMVVSAIAYQGVVNAEPIENTPTTLSTPVAIGDTFTANIPNNDSTVECTFKVTKLASGNTQGEVQVGSGIEYVSAIDASTTGTITIPNTITDTVSGEIYKITRIGDYAFFHCDSLTSTGLESNTTVTSLGREAFYNCDSLQNTGLASNTTVTSIGESCFQESNALESTGLASNKTLKSIGDGAFSECSSLQSTGLESNATVTSIGAGAFLQCSKLKSTGLESNTTVTSIGYGAFGQCDALTSTGLENNTTVKSIGDGAFCNCISLEDIIFEITTLPTMDIGQLGGVFMDSNVNIYYLPETTNPEQLDNCGAASVTKLTSSSVVLDTTPRDTYVKGQNFDPTGLVLKVTYDNGTVRDVVYSDTSKQYFSFDKTVLSTSDKEVKVTYLDKEFSLPITVEVRKIMAVQVKTASTKVNYTEGQTFDPVGLVLTTTYNDGTSEEVIYNDTTKAGFSFDKTKLALGDSAITITYKGVTTIMPITVEAQAVIDPSDSSNPVDPNNPTDSTNQGTTNGTTTDQTVVTNDNTTSISRVVMILLVTGVISVFLMKKKKEVIE